jgi:nucleotide-binding universal stress UspA family protein
VYRHILIPTDGSQLAHKAVVHGLSLAKAVGAKVTALTVEASFNVYDVPASRVNLMSAAFDEYAKYAREHAASILDVVADDAKAAGVECETVQVIQDRPYEAIVATAKQKGCDLIVMASHGRSGIAAIVLGSVTAKVLTHTTVPVLVYH